jgi:micrococcal nuclease
VRLIGVDSPLAARSGGLPDCYATEAVDRLKALLVKKDTVYLERDSVDHDSKDRLLRYVWIVPKTGKPSLLNSKLVRDGAATFGATKGDDRYDSSLKKAELTAKDKQSGLCGACGGNHVQVTPTPAPEPTAEPLPTAVPAPQQLFTTQCDPNYAGACIPPYPPDVDCGQLAANGFQVVGVNVHGLDRDHDGIACE